MSITPDQPAPGWYPDPADPARERWWAGPSWTDHTRELAPAVPPYSPPQQWGAPPVPTAPELAPYTPMGYGTGTNPYGSATHWQVEVGSPNTVPIWLIASYPAIVTVIGLLRLLLPIESSRALDFPISIGALVFLIAMAFWDSAELKRRNIEAASGWWVLLTILGYLIARRIVLKRGGIVHNAPGNVFAGQFLLALVGAVAVGVLAAFLA